MADLELAKTDPAKQFWQQVDECPAGMLGIEGGVTQFQPMAPIADPDAGRIWFFAKKDTDLVQKIGEGCQAQLVLVGKDHDFHATCTGALEQRHDREKIDEYWSSIISAWFNGGKDDPTLALLCLHPIEAEIWASSGNPIAFGWEILKSNMTEGFPEVGVHSQVRL